MQIDHWKDYWNKDISFYERIARFFRRNFFALEGKIYTEKYFQEDGIFIECGSGTSECSTKIPEKERLGIAIDICKQPLEMISAPIMSHKVQGTIFSLPFRNNTIDGIWNFGVMEHFKENELEMILKEFSRVLKNNRNIILFWPWIYSPLSLSFTARIFIRKIISKKYIKVYDTYPNAFILITDKNKYLIVTILKRCGFRDIEFKLSPYGIFTHYVIIASKMTG